MLTQQPLQQAPVSTAGLRIPVQGLGDRTRGPASPVPGQVGPHRCPGWSQEGPVLGETCLHTDPHPPGKSFSTCGPGQGGGSPLTHASIPRRAEQRDPCQARGDLTLRCKKKTIGNVPQLSLRRKEPPHLLRTQLLGLICLRNSCLASCCAGTRPSGWGPWWWVDEGPTECF